MKDYSKLVKRLRWHSTAIEREAADVIADLQRRVAELEGALACRNTDNMNDVVLRGIDRVSWKARAEAAEAVVEAARDWRCAIELSERNLRINDLEEALDRLDQKEPSHD